MKVILLLAIVFLSPFIYGQSIISHMDVYIQPSVEQQISINGNDTVVTPQYFKVPQMFIALNDTSNISEFSVKLGTSPGNGDIITRTFNYLTQGDFPDGTSYTRNGKYIRLILGKYATLSAYYAQVQITVNGTEQPAISYNE